MLDMEAKILRALKNPRKAPVTTRALEKKAGVREANRAEFLKALERLKTNHRVLEAGGKLVFADHLGLIEATIVKVTETFGFAAPEDSSQTAGHDLFIPGRKLSGAMPGDRVLLRVGRSPRRDAQDGELPEGEVYKITQAAIQPFSGVLERLADGGWQVRPDRYVKFPFRVGADCPQDANDGDKVLCELMRRGERQTEYRARILQVYGTSQSAAACSRAILAANGIAGDFSPEAREQAKTIAAAGIHPKEVAVRRDLRGEVIFTIDGADSKDLDDAVSLLRREDGWELGVHIADVSYYVAHESPLDQEAYARGTSVYYADSVVPMLPEELSNGICSLNPGEDRLAFSALLKLDTDGALVSFEFVKTVIRSKIKGVYSEVNALLDNTADTGLLQRYESLLPILLDMKELAARLKKRRDERGGINLETVESKIVLDSSGVAVDVLPRERGVSEGMIEEFMLTANEAAATFALERSLPFVFRVHETPAPDKISLLYDMLTRLDIRLKRPKEGVSPHHIAQILTRVHGSPVELVINTLVLRSMSKARYSEHCTGHFGLALNNYAHFTSPIRRYPDLTIHRILSGFVTGMKRPNIERRFRNFAAKSAMHSSERELAAMTAERDCEDCYKAEFMRGHLGETAEGVIVSVAPFGVYIRLPNTVEGLAHISSFPEGEWQQSDELSFTERRTGAKLSLGGKVRVRVAGADISAGTIDFVLVTGRE